MSNQETEIMHEDELEAQEEQEVIDGQATEEEPLEAASEEENPEEVLAEGSENVESQEEITKDARLLDRLRRDVHRYQNALTNMHSRVAQQEQELAQLRQTADLSIQTAIGHHEIAAKERLDRAKSLRQAALESGDTKSIADTDIALAEAVYNFEKVKGYKAEQELQAENEQMAQQIRQQQMYAQPQYNPYENISQETMYNSREWIKNNDWFQTNSKNYDYDRHMFAESVIQNLDNFLSQTGQQHLRGTAEYFDALDQQLSKHSSQNYGRQAMPQQNVRQPQSQGQSRMVVAPARGRSGQTNATGGSQRYEKPLSAAERRMMEGFKAQGISESAYRKSIENARKNDYFQEQLKQADRMSRQSGGY